MAKQFSPADWHNRFTQQAQWTQALRGHLYPRLGLQRAQRILDVGCGTGALLGELQTQSSAGIFGVDVQRAHLELARAIEGVHLTEGDAHFFPFPDKAFDITLSHFLLLWVRNPGQVLGEMMRLTRPGGVVLALAEPDYGGRIDYPAELAQIGQWQTQALRAQGADPLIGRKLNGLFHSAGLRDIESGVLGGQWRSAPASNERALEWDVIKADLAQNAAFAANSAVLKQLDAQAWEHGERVLFVPTFYALGWVA